MEAEESHLEKEGRVKVALNDRQLETLQCEIEGKLQEGMQQWLTIVGASMESAVVDCVEETMRAQPCEIEKRICRLERALDPPTTGRTYLCVEYKDKDVVRALGAKWDAEQKKWYVPPGTSMSPFERWR